jgi:hypothetical protein
LIFLVLLTIPANAQTFRVVNSKTKETLQFTNVFINNTAFGSISNVEIGSVGFFSLA